MNKVEEYWNTTLESLAEKLPEVVISAFLKQAKPYKYDENYFYVVVPTSFYKDKIKRDYSTDINNILLDLFNHEVKLKILLETDLKAAPADEVSIPSTNNSVDSGIVSTYKFDNFIVGNSNNFAYAVSVAVAEHPGVDYNPLFLYGGAGLGKTHLMYAIGNYLLEHNTDFKVLYVTCEQFTNDLIEALRNKTTNEFRDKYRKIDVLLLDDVQFLSGKDSVQEEFFHTFNTLVTDKKQIVMCSDRQPSEINKLTDRIVSRMKSGMIADVKPPDIVTRTAILADKANSMGISIQRDILEMIANKFQSNIREMEGLLNRVVAYAKFSNKEITMELAEDAIRDIINSDKPKITVEYIQEKVAEYYSTTVEELCSKRRTKPLATYRQIAMYLCRKLLDNPLQEIGNKFGGKDHSTVMHSCDKIAQLIETDEEIAQHIVNIEKRIK